MSKKQKRENAYYEQRLKVEFPGIYSDFVAGRIASLKSALLVTGLKPQRTRIQKLKNSWKKATADERDDFLTWLAEMGALPSFSAPAAALSPVASVASYPATIATGRYLLPSAIAKIKTVMAKRRLSPGDVMGEMGFMPDDLSLARALARNTSLRLAVIAALEKWLDANAGI